jgi:triphosphoribosyl-dephospho-CoA synthase
METGLLRGEGARSVMPSETNSATILSSTLARLAVAALRDEAELTPKPALVDRRGPGAHGDMDLELMMRSANTLEPAFARMARAAFGRTPSEELQGELAEIGRDGERLMLHATGGVNTHRGAIWSLGLLVASAAMGRASANETCAGAGELARFHRRVNSGVPSHGFQIERQWGFRGARGEAEADFPHVTRCGLPALRRSREEGTSESLARLDALLAIMCELDDTCLLFRGGLAGLHMAQGGAKRALSLGGASTAAGYSALLALGVKLVHLGASPGGSADLLAATLFLDSVEREVGRFSQWKN